MEPSQASASLWDPSLKPKAALAPSPTHAVRTPTSPFCAAWWGSLQLERLRVATQPNHFALKLKLYLCAPPVACHAWRQLAPVRFAA